MIRTGESYPGNVGREEESVRTPARAEEETM